MNFVPIETTLIPYLYFLSVCETTCRTWDRSDTSATNFSVWHLCRMHNGIIFMCKIIFSLRFVDDSSCTIVTMRVKLSKTIDNVYLRWDRWFPLRFTWLLPSSGLLRTLVWLSTDVSEQPIRTTFPWRWNRWIVPKRRRLTNIRCIITQKTE
jgi:hypothetical protein